MFQLDICLLTNSCTCYRKCKCRIAFSKTKRQKHVLYTFDMPYTQRYTRRPGDLDRQSYNQTPSLYEFTSWVYSPFLVSSCFRFLATATHPHSGLHVCPSRMFKLAHAASHKITKGAVRRHNYWAYGLHDDMHATALWLVSVPTAAVF